MPQYVTNIPTDQNTHKKKRERRWWGGFCSQLFSSPSTRFALISTRMRRRHFNDGLVSLRSRLLVFNWHVTPVTQWFSKLQNIVMKGVYTCKYENISLKFPWNNFESPEVNLQGHEDENSSVSNFEDKDNRAVPPLRYTSPWRDN
jgi:hypothetical protein